MLGQILAATLTGIFFGIITGLTPGIHVNLISIIILSLTATLLKPFNTIIIAVLIISMAVTHTFLDTIPSIFLGAPDANNVTSILPGHKLLLQGKGYEAVMLTVIGSLFGLIFSILLSPVLIKAVSFVYPILKQYIGYIILFVAITLIMKDNKSKLNAITIFFMAGVLGLAVLNFDNVQEPLFPLLSGLFGVSSLIFSINQKTKFPVQQYEEVEFENSFVAVIGSVVFGWVCSFMPGIGPSQAAILMSIFFKKVTSKRFLIIVGGLSTVNMVLSFVTLYVLKKARNGAVVTVEKLIGNITMNEFILFIGIAMVAGAIATLLAIRITKKFSKIMNKLNYKNISIIIIVMITMLVLIISKFYGLLVLVTSTALGYYVISKNIRRTHMMGCLIIPVMIYFLA